VAALDDDFHLIVGQAHVCEKTASFFDSDAYADVVDVTDGDPELLARLQDDPAPFEAPVFDDDVTRLRDAAGDAQPPSQQDATEAVLYPGPFKQIVLPGGALLRRGAAVRLTPAEADEAVERDGCLRLSGHTAEAASQPPYLTPAYAAEGAACLLDPPEPQWSVPPAAPDWSALERTTPEMRRRLAKMIAEAQPNFVLVGSSADDFGACCPSDEVTAANRLVEAGLLDSVSAPAPGRSCPAWTYALRGEIHRDGGRPAFGSDPESRRQMADALQRIRRRQRVGAVLGSVLLIFAAVSLAVAFLRPAPGGEGNGGEMPFAVAPEALPQGPAAVIYFFRSSKSCAPCEAMKAALDEVLTAEFADEVASGRLRVQRVPLDNPAATAIYARYEPAGTALVLQRYESGEATQHEKPATALELPSHDVLKQRLRERIAAALRDKR
jgi:hypothetical protein